MVRKNEEYTLERRSCGGNDIFDIRHKFTGEELFDKITLFAEVVFEPGFEIPVHKHSDDIEIYYALEGELVSLDENGGESAFLQGDYMLTGGGKSHGLRNDSQKQAKILAVKIK